ncbi:hypothetical protein [Kribbella sp. NPDC023855]|uniref:hypothetical protein n=1 Tax=Kribbella sp. NPDC023855 TaxID=3154698 RepID=UPI00340D2920
MIRKWAALAAGTTLLVTTVPAVAQAARATVEATCARSVLALPADSLPGSSAARTADPSGRYLLGEANREGRQHGQPVLWVDGVPRWLSSRQEDGESFAYSVVEGGLVVGSTYALDGTDHWIYSATTDSYRLLKPPPGLQISQLTGMNKRQDIAGLAWDEGLGRQVPFVWPAGGQPRLLAVPAGHEVLYLDDISDEGLIVGRFTPPGGGIATSYLWKSYGAQPVRLRGVHTKTVWARDIEGQWIAGEEIGGADATGLIWNTRSPRIVQVEEGVVDLNSSRDAVTAGTLGVPNTYTSLVIRSDGTRIEFPEGTLLSHIFERTNKLTAAGYHITESGLPEPVVYACTD